MHTHRSKVGDMDFTTKRITCNHWNSVACSWFATFFFCVIFRYRDNTKCHATHFQPFISRTRILNQSTLFSLWFRCFAKIFRIYYSGLFLVVCITLKSISEFHQSIVALSIATFSIEKSSGPNKGKYLKSCHKVCQCVSCMQWRELFHLPQGSALIIIRAK